MKEKFTVEKLPPHSVSSVAPWLKKEAVAGGDGFLGFLID